MKARLAAMEAEAAKLREVGCLPFETVLRPSLAVRPLHILDTARSTSACLLHTNDSNQIMHF